jgi:hypothetical protein
LRARAVIGNKQKKARHEWNSFSSPAEWSKSARASVTSQKRDFIIERRSRRRRRREEQEEEQKGGGGKGGKGVVALTPGMTTLKMKCRMTYWGVRLKTPWTWFETMKGKVIIYMTADRKTCTWKRTYIPQPPPKVII